MEQRLLLARTHSPAQPVYERRQKNDWVMWAIVGFWLIFILATIFMMMRGGDFAVASVMLLILLASSAMGGIFGFIFAVPSVVAKGAGGAVPEGSGEGRHQIADTGQRLTTNTNLQRVSDWLTTMLVGVGLSQINQVNSYLRGFSDFLKEQIIAFGAPLKAPELLIYLPTVGPMILILGLCAGFVGIYVFTRLMLVPQFNLVEGDLVGDKEIKGKAGEEIKALADTVADKGNPVFKHLATGGSPTVNDTLRIMQNALYVQGGYKRVIDLRGSLANSATSELAEYWFYLAAAYGQQHKSIIIIKSKNSKNNLSLDIDDQLRSARDNALDCARRAVDIDPSYADRLWAISTPKAYDDDLSDFRDVADFRRICGRGAKSESS